MRTICRIADTKCEYYHLGLCMDGVHPCKYTLELSYSTPTADVQTAQFNYLAKILETQQEILKRLEKQK